MNATIQKNNLPLILLAAVTQGFALYALHLSMQSQHWPATQSGWLFGFCAAAVFVPLTVQMLAEHSRGKALWLTAASLLVAFFYFGWHHGSRVIGEPTTPSLVPDQFFVIAFVLLVLWLMLLPFVQWRLSSGHWRASYHALFNSAWRNKLMLAEAALFTGLFWLLLMLWQALFNMLGIKFFRELFQEPLFIYPVTSLTFGIALHLIGSVDKLTSVILEQLLNVLKWLAVIAALILTLFTVALAFKLPRLFASDMAVIGAAWLLWLIAVIVLLLNAAYRDGSVADPYPRWIGVALRCVVPLTIVVSLTALYAMYVRIDAYGFTVERVWALIVAASAFAYSVGYSAAAWLPAFRAGTWMSGMSRVNIWVAWALIATISLTLTPLLSPYRIAASSQYRMALRQPSETAKNDLHASTPFTYLRFSAGEYGAARLQTLVKLENHPRAAQIRDAAQSALDRKAQWEPAQLNAAAVLGNLAVYPSGRSIDESLRARIEADLRTPALALNPPIATTDVVGLFIDLNDDDIDEFVLIAGPRAHVYESTTESSWRNIGAMVTGAGPNMNVKTELERGNLQTQPHEWRDLIIGERRYRLNDMAGTR